jgi:hypothetical protein
MVDIIKALSSHAQGNIALHKANIMVYLENPVGIGEHSDILEAIQGELDKIAVHQDRLDLLRVIQKESENKL